MNKYWTRANVLLLLTCIPLYLFLANWTNTLSNNGNWYSSKSQLEKGVMGAMAFELTPVTLAGERLDLGKWFGYQEVSYRQNVDQLGSIGFQVVIPDSSYLMVYLSDNNDTLSAFRLSTHPEYPSAILRLYEHEFVEKHILKLGFVSNKATSIHLELNRNNWKATIEDTQVVIGPPITENYKQLLTFQAFRNGAILDDIVLRDEQGELIFKEGFSPQYFQFSLLAFILLFLLLANLLLWLLKRYISLINYWLIWLAVFTFGVLVIYLSIIQFKYPRPWMIRWQDKETNIESFREVNERLLTEIDKSKNDDLKIMFLGSSQTWGAGTTEANSSFMEILHAHEFDSCSINNMSIVNASVSGYNSHHLNKLFIGSWSIYQPDYLFINLSNNDSNPQAFQKNIEAIIAFSKDSMIEVILILEANDHDRLGLIAHHHVLLQLCQDHNLTCLDLHGYLQTKKDDGLLFWDFVHFTDYGHKLTAEFLENYVESDICD